MGPRPDTPTTAGLDPGPTTATSTTARSCSIRTATAPRPSTTGALRRGGIIDHLWIRVADLIAARRFYETIAPHAGLRLRRITPERVQFAGRSGSFSLVPGAPTENAHLAFPTGDDATVQRFHEAATRGGYRSNGGPGERPEYHPGYYAAYVLDPDGNNIEVVNHHRD